ncbi:tetratricopeptide repeat protein [Saliterribacillus persicus]|uniref:TPR repeat protein n=1 Tax=Saliterribacillus persicus TaxID=930114 RepID=A0A368Y9J2_9BACI|nr:tetratricopeptide repeat protein [Saliterribacillus persicus]RCW76872.1 TPR repeat protein [Saliterribacillus persicus]
MTKKSTLTFIVISIIIISGIITINLFQGKDKIYQQGARSNESQIEKLEIYLKENEEDPTANLNLGLRYYHDQQYKKAISKYKKVIELEPDNALAWHRLANTHVLQEDFQKAFNVRQKVVELEADATSYLNLSTLDVLFEPSTALKHAKIALDLAEKSKEDNIDYFKMWHDALQQFDKQQKSGDISEGFITLIKSEISLEKTLLLEYIGRALNADVNKETENELVELRGKIHSYQSNILDYSDLSSG